MPASDTGKFNLQIDGSTAGTGANVGNGGTTGAVPVSPGAHTVGETAGTDTSLSNYTTTINGACAANGSVTLALGESKTCTITNTRKAAAKPPRTPGYWKNHESQTTALLPITLGNYTVNTFQKATGVFNNMNCGSSHPNSAVGCLAGHLLASKLNLKNGADSCIQAVVTKADNFLKGQSVTYGSITATGVNYTGPNATYTLTSAQRNLAIALKNALDKYNNGGGCT